MKGVRRADYGGESSGEAEERFSEDQPRDEHGMWTNDAGGGPGGSGVVVRRPGVGTVAKALPGGRVPNAIAKGAVSGMKVLGQHLPSAHSMTRPELVSHMSSGHAHTAADSETAKQLVNAHDVMHTKAVHVPHTHTSRADLL